MKDANEHGGIVADGVRWSDNEGGGEAIDRGARRAGQIHCNAGDDSRSGAMALFMRCLYLKENSLMQNKIDMKEPLIDAEGFPRADIDVYAVRNARVNIIRSNNDRQALTDRIEKALHELHATVSGVCLYSIC